MDLATQEFTEAQTIVSNEIVIEKSSSVSSPGISRSADTVCLEPNCNFQCKRIPALRKHLQNVHNMSQQMDVFQFKSMTDFQNWLSEIEKEYSCTYMRRRGWQKNKQSRSTTYYCNRGGSYTSNATKKQPKLQGTCKMGVECTSSVTVKVFPPTAYCNTGMVEVDAYLQHYGHNAELGHTRIPEKVKDDIANKLSQGISRHKIIDDIRESLDGFSAIGRQHLISLQDLYNIERRNGIVASRGRYSTESGITAQTWIEAMQKSEDNPVILIKYQQEAPQEKHKFLSEDDFVLVLQTKLQANMLKKFGPMQYVCIDITQGNLITDVKIADHPSEFYMLAIEILSDTEDGYKQPQPVAWCVSNRKDKDIINMFLTCIKCNMQDITLTPAYIIVPTMEITENEDWYSVWMSVFGAGPRKLISSWHVKNAWLRQLSKLCPAVMSSQDEKLRVVGNLETVLNEATVKGFVTLLEECLADLRLNLSTSDFGEYFGKNFSLKTEEWAFAYRSDETMRNDTAFKLFHMRMAKHIYHEGLKRKQLDVLIKTLMKYSRDKVLTKLRNTFMSDNAEAYKSVTEENHNKSLKFPLDWVLQIQHSENEFLVKSESLIEGDNYGKKFITQYTVNFSSYSKCRARIRCSLWCSTCQVCSHFVTCSCMKQDSNYKPDIFVSVCESTTRIQPNTDKENCLKNQDLIDYKHDKTNLLESTVNDTIIYDNKQSNISNDTLVRESDISNKDPSCTIIIELEPNE